MLTIKDQSNKEAQPIIVSRDLGKSAAQQWIIRYSDALGDEAYQKKGQRDADHNMLSLEPFYLRSKLPMQRVAECVGANNIVLKKWYKNRKA
jgi:hypothetical protein